MRQSAAGRWRSSGRWREWLAGSAANSFKAGDWHLLPVPDFAYAAVQRLGQAASASPALPARHRRKKRHLIARFDLLIGIALQLISRHAQGSGAAQGLGPDAAAGGQVGADGADC